MLDKGVGIMDKEWMKGAMQKGKVKMQDKVRSGQIELKLRGECNVRGVIFSIFLLL